MSFRNYGLLITLPYICISWFFTLQSFSHNIMDQLRQFAKMFLKWSSTFFLYGFCFISKFKMAARPIIILNGWNLNILLRKHLCDGIVNGKNVPYMTLWYFFQSWKFKMTATAHQNYCKGPKENILKFFF